jgi:hypothetical protein
MQRRSLGAWPRRPVEKASLSLAAQVFFLRAEVGHSGSEFAKADDGALLLAQPVGFQSANSFAHYLRGAPTQLTDEGCRPLLRPFVQLSLNYGGHT